MSDAPLTILAIDDEPDNLKIIAEFLELDETQQYTLLSAEDGERGMALVEEHSSAIDVILLDRMMPGMDGIEVMAVLSRHKRFSQIPVIMQTACASNEQAIEGIEAGVYYYLTKPYDPDVMLAIIKAAVDDKQRLDTLRSELKEYHGLMDQFTQLRAQFQTLDQAQRLAAFLATAYPNPEKALLGLSELMINAIEHGNLGIGYERKTELIQHGVWEEEINRLAALPAYTAKWAQVHFRKDRDQIHLKIEDQGQGFDWTQYLHINPERATHTHGRGIALANLVGFDTLEYEGKGNIVHCRSPLTMVTANAA